MRRAAVGVQREHLRGDLLLLGGLLDQRPGQLRILAVLHRPAHGVAAEHVEDHIQIEVGPLRRALELGEGGSDLIDYWSVDFDFSDEVFHNQWQTYRTRENPALATQSDWHEYSEPGRYALVVKIIDIFGNDTTKLAEVRIK